MVVRDGARKVARKKRAPRRMVCSPTRALRWLAGTRRACTFTTDEVCDADEDLDEVAELWHDACVRVTDAAAEDVDLSGDAEERTALTLDFDRVADCWIDDDGAPTLARCTGVVAHMHTALHELCWWTSAD